MNTRKNFQRFFILGILIHLVVACDAQSPRGMNVSGEAAGDGGYTNLQEQGVDEPDTVKISSRHFYVVGKDRIEVVGRAGLNYVGNFPINAAKSHKLFTYNDLLIAMESGDSKKWSNGYYSESGGQTLIKVFRSATDSLPELLQEKTFSGHLFESRVIGGKLILVFRDSIQSADHLDQIIPKNSDGSLSEESCRRIAKPAAQDSDLRLTRVEVVNLNALSSPIESVAVLGGGDHIYMGQKSLYLVKSISDWGYNSGSGGEKIILSKIDLSLDKPSVRSMGAVPGRVKDSWAFKEFPSQGTLLVATTFGQVWDKGAQNHLWAIKEEGQNLKIVNSVNDYGSGEEIRAIRYVNNTAYVVTFKKTDPLYAFDISNPDSPKLLGELKVPGFSTYLHPVAGNRLIGIGFDAEERGNFALFQGIQVSLFDVNDPMKMFRTDNHILGARGSYSDINSDHHAFFYDESAKLLGVPIVALRDSSYQSSSNLDFSGAVLYGLENDLLIERTRLSHHAKMSSQCLNQMAQWQWWQNKTHSLDVNRIYNVDGRVVAVSQFGLSAHPLGALGATAQADMTFPALPACNDWQYRY